MKGFKNLVSYTQQKKYVAGGSLIFKAFISSASQIMKEKFIAKTLGQLHPFSSSFKFLYQITCLGTGNLDHCPIHNKFFIYQ